MTDNGKNVHLLPPAQLSKLEEAVETMRRNETALIEYHRILARVHREAYLAYLKAGFTESQAIELTKALKA